MITSQLLHPASIVVVGASNNVHKPGGAILKNLIHGGYTGELSCLLLRSGYVRSLSFQPDLVRKRMRARFWKTVFWKRRIGTALR